MTQVFQGKRLLPLAVIGKINGEWSLQDPPEAVAVTDVRRDYQVQAGHIYQSITEFLGGVQVISRATVQPLDMVLNVVLTCGRTDSPVSYELQDITPDFVRPPDAIPTSP